MRFGWTHRRPALKLFCAYDFIVVGYILTAAFLSWIFDFEISYRLLFTSTYDLAFFQIFFLIWLIMILITTLRLGRQDGDRKVFGPEWRAIVLERHVSLQRIYDVVHALVALKIVLVVYCCIKQAIPRINDSRFDEELLTLDIFIHGGVNPMTATVAIFKSPAASEIIDWLYVAWYALKAPLIILFTLVANRSLHVRFFSAYFSLWAGGGLLAVLLPSWGPIYVTPEWFAGLHKPIADSIQAMLWHHYTQSVADPASYRAWIYEGIAAFPSIHVACVALFAFFSLELSRPLGWALIFYTAIVQVGSVHLGWHYAVDGYFGIFLAYFVYRLFLPRIHR